MTGLGKRQEFSTIGSAAEEVIRRVDACEGRVRYRAAFAGLKTHLLNRFKPRYAVEYGGCAISHQIHELN